MKHIILLFLVFLGGVNLLASIPLFAAPWDTINPASYVDDRANVLSPEIETKLNLEFKTLNDSGKAQGLLVTIKSLENYDVATYANNLFRKVGVGDKKLNNGFLILLAIDDRKDKIEVGYGLEGTLTDLRTGRILQDAQTSLRAGDYNTAVTSMVESSIGLINQDPDIVSRVDTVQKKPQNYTGLITTALFVFLGIIPWFASILGRSKNWYAGGIIGAGVGIIPGFALNSLLAGIGGVLGLGLAGLLFDYFVSKNYRNQGPTNWMSGGNIPWIFDSRGGGGNDNGGGFGGFGGGSSGGGGSSNTW